MKREHFREIMQNYDDDITEPFSKEEETEEEKEIAKRMIMELWKHQQESQGGWYYKHYLMDNIYDNENLEYEALQEKVYQRLVDAGCIDVLYSNPNCCAIGKNASISVYIKY